MTLSCSMKTNFGMIFINESDVNICPCRITRCCNSESDVNICPEV